MDWKVGDWAVFDLRIVQIKEIRDGGSMEVSDGMFNTFGNLADRLRPLTLRNKATIENFDWHYKELRKIRGQRGFNYPDINRYFCQLSLDAIDGDEKDASAFDKGTQFVEKAKDHTPIIDGVELFQA